MRSLLVTIVTHKAGPGCFSIGRKFDSESILFAVSKKVPDLVNRKQESGLVTFYQDAQKAHLLEQGERESLAFELRF